jgi:hypothetical protein
MRRLGKLFESVSPEIPQAPSGGEAVGDDHLSSDTGQGTPQADTGQTDGPGKAVSESPPTPE